MVIMVFIFIRSRVGRMHPRDEQGAVAVLTAIVMVVLLLCAAIVVDLGMARDVRRQSQNAADAASLAGANALYPSTKVCSPAVAGGPPCIADATKAVKSYALNNFQVSDSDWSSCTVAAGSALAVPSTGPNCISFDSASTLVRVYIPTKHVPTFFGGIIGKPEIQVGSNAQAVYRFPVTCSLCVLGNVVSNNSDFSVAGGSVAVNGDVTVGPQSFWTADSIGVVGTMSGGILVAPTPAATTIDHFLDPLDPSLILPSTSGLSTKTNPCGAGGGTGIYGSFTVKPPIATCVLKPGLYVITGQWNLQSATSMLDGTAGVTLYVKSSSGGLDFSTGKVKIIAPTLATVTGGALVDYAIIYDRHYAGSTLNLQGSSSAFISGIVYAPSTSMIFNGTTSFEFKYGPIIVGGVGDVLHTPGSVGNSGILITSAREQVVTPEQLHLNQ